MRDTAPPRGKIHLGWCALFSPFPGLRAFPLPTLPLPLSGCRRLVPNPPAHSYCAPEPAHHPPHSSGPYFGPGSGCRSSPPHSLPLLPRNPAGLVVCLPLQGLQGLGPLRGPSPCPHTSLPAPCRQSFGCRGCQHQTCLGGTVPAGCLPGQVGGCWGNGPGAGPAPRGTRARWRAPQWPGPAVGPRKHGRVPG